MTTLRTRIFIVASVVLLLILAISIFLVTMSKKKAATAEQPGGGTAATNTIDQSNFTGQIVTPPTEIPKGTPVQPLSTEDQLKNAAKQIAKIFVERYGTYSTDNNSDNIREVEVFASKDLWAILSKKITSGTAAGGFVGMTTKAITSEISEWKADSAVVDISTMRTETRGTTVTEKNQAVKVWLVKSGNSWLVDDIKWQ